MPFINFRKIPSRLLLIFKEALQISLPLFKIMIPIIIGVKILKEIGAISYLALPLQPLMKLVNLPAEMGLVWATAIVNNLYGGMIVFLSIVENHPLNVAQVTVLTSMMLVAHALPIEVKIAQQSGNRFIFQLFARLFGALALGFLLNFFYSTFGWLQEKSNVFWQGAPEKTISLAQWAFDQIQNLGMIFCIILALVVLMRLLKKIRIIDFLIWILQPLLRILGIGKEAATITIVGMTMGLTYGGGMIIHESKSGKVAPRDVFTSLTLMGLCHSIIEDTLLMKMLGGHMSGIFWGRLLFSLILVCIMARLLPFLSPKIIDRFLFALPSRS